MRDQRRSLRIIPGVKGRFLQKGEYMESKNNAEAQNYRGLKVSEDNTEAMRDRHPAPFFPLQ